MMNEYRPGQWVSFIRQEGDGRYITLSGKVIGVWRNGGIAQCQYWIVARYTSKYFGTLFEVWAEDILEKEAEEWTTENSYGNYG